MSGIHIYGGGNVSPKIGMSYVEPEPVKLSEDPVYHPVLKLRESQSELKHSMAEVVEHSLQVAVQEFKKIHGPKISVVRWLFSQCHTYV